jgi:hypothetical protein
MQRFLIKCIKTHDEIGDVTAGFPNHCLDIATNLDYYNSGAIGRISALFSDGVDLM